MNAWLIDWSSFLWMNDWIFFRLRTTPWTCTTWWTSPSLWRTTRRSCLPWGTSSQRPCRTSHQTLGLSSHPIRDCWRFYSQPPFKEFHFWFKPFFKQKLSIELLLKFCNLLFSIAPYLLTLSPVICLWFKDVKSELQIKKVPWKVRK